MEPMTAQDWDAFQRTYPASSGNSVQGEHLKHLLNKHDGEARFVGDWRWVPFPLCEEDIRKACFWDYQFATSAEARKWLYWRSQEEWRDEDLTSREIKWILEQEENNQTSLIKWEDNSASGETHWRIVEGNCITLGELFAFGRNVSSCYDLYRKYLTLSVFVRKKVHGMSHSAQGTKRRNSKMLNFVETGSYALRRR